MGSYCRHRISALLLILTVATIAVAITAMGINKYNGVLR